MPDIIIDLIIIFAHSCALVFSLFIFIGERCTIVAALLVCALS